MDDAVPSGRLPLRVQSVQFGDALATDSERLKDRLADIKGQPYSRFAIEIFENEQSGRSIPPRVFCARKSAPPKRI